MCFDKEKPAEYLCSLYRMQNRFRKGDHIAKENVKKLLPLFDERDELLPVIRITLHITHLLLNPCWGSAWHVLYVISACLEGCHTDHHKQRGCSEFRRHPCLRHATLGIPSRHSAHTEHAGNLWREPYPVVLQRAPRSRALFLEVAKLRCPLSLPSRSHATHENEV